MLRGLKKPKILLALIISLSIPILSGYLLYCDLADDVLFYPFSPEEKFENPDLDDQYLLPDSQNNPFGSIGSIPLFRVFFPETSVFEQLSVFSFPSSFLEQKPLVLRC